MRIACLGGGPAGLYFAIAMKRREPAHEITVVERNRPYDTFGWGVVLSDETLANLDASDPESADAIRRAFVYWDDIAVFYRGTVTRSSGHGFCGIGRKRLLKILQDRARGARRRAAVRNRVRQRRPLSRLRSGRRRRRRQLEDSHRAGPRLQARHRRARLQVHLARHAPAVPRRVHLHLRGDRARLDLGARLSVRCRYGDVHRRVLRGDVAPVRLRRA